MHLFACFYAAQDKSIM